MSLTERAEDMTWTTSPRPHSDGLKVSKHRYGNCCKLQCCGLFSYRDWEDSIPDTCLCSQAEEREGVCQNVYTASFLTKKLNITGKRVNLAIWDTAGQERFHALGPIYYRDSNGAVLVYDVTDEDSFQKVKNWVKELRKMLGNDICFNYVYLYQCTCVLAALTLLKHIHTRTHTHT
ncbi:hypothetical protein CgunFtcFv8_009858 [Champsocephalus gunnari]|uniref:Ras-related protein Rab-21 n=1 Tax=Champsocephalus gunnari TaxID=52237 RepID=A0AAN8C5E4_CHAGU|nr:hypothetical protein CgunFtcFv8_009858 [Champsocephalus gunnari]